MSRLIAPPGATAPADPRDLRVADQPHRPAHDEALFVRPVAPVATGSSAEQAGAGASTDRGGAETVDARAVFEEWYGLVETYRELAADVHVLDPVDVWPRLKDRTGTEDLAPPWELPDMIFAANQSLPFPDEKAVVLSQMGRADRRDEPAYLGEWYRQHGYVVHELQTLSGDQSFEGMGDAIWHPGRRLLWGGVTERTSEAAYEELAERLDTAVVTLDVQNDAVDADFFHMDICFSVLDEHTVMIVPELFDDEDRAVVHSVWDTVVECPLSEGSPDEGYAANAHCVDGETVVIQAGNERTVANLRDAGFTVHEVATGELIEKCKGSVFCSKLMLP